MVSPMSGENYSYTQLENGRISQVLSVKFEMSGSTYSSVFTDTTNMKYTFKFIDESNNPYYIDSSNAVYNENEKSTIVTVEWNVEDMKGNLFDPIWGNGNFRCTIYAKTVTNFIYSIGEIKMKATGEKPIVDERKDINLEFLNN